MNIYVRLSGSRRDFDSSQAQPSLEFRHVGGQGLRLDMVVAVLALLLSLDDPGCRQLLQMMRYGWL